MVETLKYIPQPFFLFNSKIPCQRLGISDHTCNPGYSKGRDQEYFGSKPAYSQNPILKTCITKKGTQTKIIKCQILCQSCPDRIFLLHPPLCSSKQCYSCYRHS
jgi:hypothetical protein